MTVGTAVLSCALVFSSGVASGATAPADLSGRWVLNRELSDDAREKMREGVDRGGSGGRGGPGGGGLGRPGGGVRMGAPPGGMDDDDARQSMRAIVEPAEELAIGQTETELTVEEKFGRTRHLHPDGRKYKTDNGTSEIKALWKEGRLRVETKRARGSAVVEVWELVPDASRLIVNVKLEGGFGPRVELKRVYDRAKESPAP